MHLFIAFLSGLLMSAGITISMMIDPQKVIGFLNINNNWDPSLILVMASALTIYSIGYFFLKRRGQPLQAKAFSLPVKSTVDKPLLIGAATFGIGWGMAGYCPGPALAAISSGQWPVLAFTAAMISGWFIARQSPLRR